MMLFLQHGADINAHCKFPSRGYHENTGAGLLATYKVCPTADLIGEVIDLEQGVELRKKLKKSRIAQDWLGLLPYSARIKWLSRPRIT